MDDPTTGELERRLPTRAAPSGRRDSTSPRGRTEGLTRAALPLVDSVARKLWLGWGRRYELEELAAVGRAALVPVVRAYDPQRAPFVPYVVQRVRWAIQDEVRAMHRGRRPPRRRGPGTLRRTRPSSGRGRPRCSAVDPNGTGERWSALSSTPRSGPERAADSDGPVGAQPCPERAVMSKLEAEQVREAVARLPRHERVLVVSHYFQGRRFDHVAAHLGISKSWASRLHARALRRLSRSLRRAGPCRS